MASTISLATADRRDPILALPWAQGMKEVEGVETMHHADAEHGHCKCVAGVGVGIALGIGGASHATKGSRHKKGNGWNAAPLARPRRSGWWDARPDTVCSAVLTYVG